MGVIKRQGIKFSIVSYLATSIGALSTLFIYPLDKSIYGYALFLVATATFFYPFMSGGVASLAVRFFPDMKNKSQNNQGLLGFIQLGSILAFLIVSLLGYLLQEQIRAGIVYLKMDADLVFDNILFILVLTFLITQNNILTAYTSNFQRIVIPNLLTNLLFKLILPILVLLYFHSLIDKNIFGWGIVGYHFLGFLGLTIYLHWLNGYDWLIKLRYYSWPKIKEMLTYSGFGILGAIGNVLAFRIDLFMVPTLLGLLDTGIYGISQFIGSSVELPAKALFQISAPIVSEKMKARDYAHVATIYSKASINLTIIGLLFMALIMGSLDALLQLTNDYESLVAGKTVVLWIGLTKLVDMATSVNTYIIGYSKYFKYNFYILSLLAATNIALNLFLISFMGIVGAALATFLSISVANLMRLLFVWNRFGMQPFSYRHLIAIVVAGLAYGIAYLIPLDSIHPIGSIIIRSIVIILVFVLSVFNLNLSEDINELIQNVYVKIMDKIVPKR